MRLENRAFIAALAMLVLCAVVSAQTLRPESDPRNQSPSVGTGGPVGGPTGLFTIYDGSTIRKGEFTFSVAYSNYDRDPGNVDITDLPTSFNIGLNDHIELFFKTNAYRGIKVNNPQNLSSFYLPNVGLCGPTKFCSGAAVVLAPTAIFTPFPPPGGTGGAPFAVNIGNPVFRPFNNQPFIQFPFAPGSSAGGFGQATTPGVAAGTVAFTFGAPFGGTRNFGSASNFPGVGSLVGGILPGIVLATANLPNAGGPPITGPSTWTIAPSYLPDAPFVSRPYGQSSFTDFVVGAKIRLTGPNNPLGAGIIPFYRWYPDNANDSGGFNQLQRGASPGGNIGDFGFIGFIDGRLSPHVNVSVNAGYIFNSNPTSSAMGGAVLLDRPNEFLAGVGIDFPVNKHFQPVFEARSTQYVGGRTPNAFPNNPVELLGGFKIYPQRWFGLGFAYRWQMNQQDQNNPTSGGTVNIIRVTGSLAQPVIVTPVAVQGPTNGFRHSDDANGFIIQAWAGRRNARSLPPIPNGPPTVSLSSSTASITTPCAEGTSSESCTPSTNWQVQLSATGSDPDNDPLLYGWTVTGGKISGEGKDVTWDLTGAMAGTYTAAVQVSDGNGHTDGKSTAVTIAVCTGCHPPPCPTVSVSCAGDVEQGSPATFTAEAISGNVTYNWSVSAGTITGGQGTASITVDTANLGGQTVTATVEVGGLDPACGRTASCSTAVKTPPTPPSCSKLDEYGNIKFNDEKARLDAFASALQNQPGSEGVILAYGTCEGEGLARANRAKDYLVNTRGIDAGRVTVTDGGCRAELLVQLYVCEAGAAKPMASTDGAVSPCPDCKKKKPVRHRAKKKGSSDHD